MSRTLAQFAVLVLAAGPLAAQWASLSDSGAPVQVTESMVLHDDGTSLMAFSAIAKTWRPIAPTASTVVGASAWAALIQLPSGEYRAYSARLHAVADLLDGVGTPAIAEIAGSGLDDVVLVQRSEGAGMPVLNAAYSAQTNTWASVTTSAVPIAMDLSRFVVALWDDAAGQVYGFGARRAFWQGQAVNTCLAPMLADGNVAVIEHQDAANSIQLLAFSAIANAWALSPDLTPNTIWKLDHDGICMLTGSPNACSPCAFSSYTRTWVVSPDVGLDTDFECDTCDKVVLVHRLAGAHPEVQAIGATPHNAWAGLFGAAPAMLDKSEDALIAEDPGVVPPVILGFSGLSGGGWVARNVTGAVTYEGTPEHGCLVSDAAATFHAFSPAVGAWAPALALAGATARVNDCAAIVESPTAAHAWSVRHNAWVAAPAAAAGSALTYSVFGNVAVRERTPPGGTTVLDAFDERSGAWKTHALGDPMVFGKGSANVLLKEDSSGNFDVYSVQRSDLSDPGAAWSGSAIDVSTNIVLLSNGTDHNAFGSPADGHVFYDWPLDTETHAFARPAAPVQLVRAAVRANPGATAFLGIAPAPFFPGLPIPGIAGLLHLDLAFPPLIVQMGALPANPFGVAPVALTLPPGMGAFIQVWAQGGWIGGGSAAFVGNVPEPIRIY